MSYAKDQAAKKVKAAFAGIKPEYDRLADASWNEYVNSLPYGSSLPEKGKIYDDARRDQFREFVTNQRGKALQALEAYQTDIDNTMSIAPTEEALRAVQAFALRDPDRMTKEEYSAEINRLVTRYGENYSVYMGLRDLAAKAGVFVEKHVLSSEAEKISRAKELVYSSFDASDMIYHGGVSSGQNSMFDLSVDQHLSD